MLAAVQTDEALRDHLTLAGLFGGDLAPTTLDLAREWIDRSRKVCLLVESAVALSAGPGTVFVHRSSSREI